jgi:hypothetical protein
VTRPSNAVARFTHPTLPTNRARRESQLSGEGSRERERGHPDPDGRELKDRTERIPQGNLCLSSFPLFAPVLLSAPGFQLSEPRLINLRLLPQNVVTNPITGPRKSYRLAWYRVSPISAETATTRLLCVSAVAFPQKIACPVFRGFPKIICAFIDRISPCLWAGKSARSRENRSDETQDYERHPQSKTIGTRITYENESIYRGNDSADFWHRR